ncbi:hypothetical protein HPB52_008199 [Rhipicephalus sanguineus]|uniref:Uncharacterized protein n=1 Tax=Rhipicephalus sanguineus TaxID=34632 RepID=A0A9D4SS82_RHISA|nr:hypothetical protein HPB52_008199 [Rhipicephalus sanguineus]
MSFQSFAEDEDGYSSNYHVGSLPRDYAYGPDDVEGDPTHATQCARKRKILLMGSKGSGKSSIEKVVFHKMSPNETLFLESTNKIVRNDISNSSFVKLDIWDIPGQVDFVDQVSDFKNSL